MDTLELKEKTMILSSVDMFTVAGVVVQVLNLLFFKKSKNLKLNKI